MSTLLALMGLNHRSAPVEFRERCCVPAETLPSLLAEMKAAPGVESVMLLSTCNRTEIFASLKTPDAHNRLWEILARSRGMQASDFESRLYHYFGAEALRHVFRVASSLDSMVLGEPQILGQFKDAYAAARESGAASGLLGRAAERALRVAKRVRSETGIAGGAVSVGYAAVELARRIYDDMSRQNVAVLGAGEMAVSMLEHLHDQRIRSLFIVNRGYETAVELAARFGGSAMPFERMDEALAQADIVLASTAHPGHLVTRARVEQMLSQRRGKPLFMIDIAMPRNIEPSVNELEGVFLYNIDDLQQVVQENIRGRKKEAARAEAAVDEETAAFARYLEAVEVEPLIRSMHDKAEAAVREELARTLPRMASLSEAEREALARMSEALAKRLLHDPILTLKEASRNGAGAELADAARRLFKVKE